MRRRDLLTSTFALATGRPTFSLAAAQQKGAARDLSKLGPHNGLEVFNRTVTTLHDGGKNGLRLGEGPGEGLAYFEGLEFANGTIELDLRGKDVQQQSFLGIAFHGVNKTTYDAVYFRPFNFRTEMKDKREHAVQYISHPIYTWQKLRAEHPGQYEQPIDPVPDPNAWFHARILITSPKVSVFVNDAKSPCLVVEQLNDRRKGRTGLWVGNTSGGDFANFQIDPA